MEHAQRLVEEQQHSILRSFITITTYSSWQKHTTIWIILSRVSAEDERCKKEHKQTLWHHAMRIAVRALSRARNVKIDPKTNLNVTAEKWLNGRIRTNWS